MDFAFSEEQETLRAEVRRFLESRYPIDRVAAIADGEGFDRAEWHQVADAGWLGISLPEEAGGSGLSFVEEMVVCEEMGRALYPGPWLASAILGMEALWIGRHTELIGDAVTGRRIPTLAWAGSDGRFDIPPPKVEWDDHNELLSATRFFVPDLGIADAVVIVGSVENGLGVWVLGPNEQGASQRELPTVDGTRRMGELVLEHAAASQLVKSLDHDALEHLRNRALAALAAEAVGVASRALEYGVDFARSRQQFGRSIGTFQAVSHSLAQAFVELETARSLAYWAGWAVSENAPEASTAAAAAKARAAEAAISVCERAIQVHGGIGFTWEHPLHRYYKRALQIAAFMGWGPEHRARVAAELLD
jgi:alkylation response protein AidB-like acyl-CoA dehydrogenase